MSEERQFRMAAITREPAWLTAAIDQDIERVKAMLAFGGITLPDSDVIMLTLGEHQTIGMSKAQFIEWDERCDGCKKYLPGFEDLMYCNVVRQWNEHTQVCITFAACLDCLAKP